MALGWGKSTAGVGLSEPAWVRWSLVGVAIAFVSLVLLLPLVLIFAEAFSAGWSAYLRAITHAETQAAMRLSLLAVVVAVPVNTVCGVLAAWCIAKFEFRGKNVLITLLDLPFAISPVVVGLLFVLLVGVDGLFGPLLRVLDVAILFTPAAVVLVIVFGTLPFVARELIPLMQAQGTSEEQAALTLGASGLQTFFLVTLPNIKWGLLYGVVLAQARALGEFGSVYVVSGRIRGETNTIPLHIEVLYNEYMTAAAFSVASVLTLFAFATLGAKIFVEWRQRQALEQAGASAGKAPTRRTAEV